MTATAFIEPPAVADLGAALPAVAPATARASRVLHDARLEQAWAGLSGNVGFACVSGPARGPLQRLVVECVQGRIELLVDTSASGALELAAACGDQPLPEGLEQLAGEAAVAPALARLRSLGLDDPRVLVWRRAEASVQLAALSGWCSVRNDRGELARFVVIDVAPAVCDALEAGLRHVRPTPTEAAALRVRGRVCLAERVLRRSLVRSLGPGDVLLLVSAGAEGADSGARLRFGMAGRRSLCCPVHVGETVVTLEGELEMQEDILDEAEGDLQPDDGDGPFQDANGDSGPGGSPFDSLDLPVRCEINTIAVSLSRLQSLQPGQVLELQTPLASATVRLTVFGRVVGTAELVAVGDQLGARITRLAESHAEPAT